MPIFDDGSSIQTFDDGSTLVTDSSGGVSSTPSTDGGSGGFSFSGLGQNTSSGLGSIASAAGDAVNGLAGLGASQLRLAGSGLFQGGLSGALSRGLPTVNIQTLGNLQKAKDWRVRLSLPSKFPTGVFGGPVGVLSKTNGVIFPYTPSVTVAHNARYQEQALTHSNYKNYFYEGSDVAAITISGDFTVQNVDEGQYLLGVIYFLRACTKMFFGNDQMAGNPPPILFLDGYGDFYFPHVSCVLTNFTHTLPDSVDYVEVPASAGTVTNNLPGGSASAGSVVRLPTQSTISVTVQPVYSRKNVYENFSVGAFSSGKLLGGQYNGSDVSGFI